MMRLLWSLTLISTAVSSTNNGNNKGPGKEKQLNKLAEKRLKNPGGPRHPADCTPGPDVVRADCQCGDGSSDVCKKDSKHTCTVAQAQSKSSQGSRCEVLVEPRDPGIGTLDRKLCRRMASKGFCMITEIKEKHCPVECLEVESEAHDALKPFCDSLTDLLPAKCQEWIESEAYDALKPFCDSHTDLLPANCKQEWSCPVATDRSSCVNHDCTWHDEDICEA